MSNPLALPPPALQPIAVIGMGCHYPDASQLNQLWENILGRRCQFREFPQQRLPLSEYYDPDPATPDKTYGNRGAFIDGFVFDWVKRRIPQKTVDTTDIVHWLALEVAAQALANAGYTRNNLPGHKTGVILGNTLTGEHTRSNTMRLRWPYVQRVLRSAAEVKGMSPQMAEDLLETMEKFYKSVFAPITEDSLAGGLSNTIAGRICNFFNLDGGGYTVDGACSSSLIAVVTAANALSNGDLDLALAGGVDISLDTFELIGFAKTGALTGQDMAVYDRRASGFIPGEGCGFVVLKRLADAQAEGNYIYAIVNGWGISSDGKGGITAPSGVGQSKALLRAYEKAGYSPQSLHFIEGHGTGTPVGDRAEIEGVALAMKAQGEAPPRSCGMTSFKSLVGHTKAAAGIGGLIKAVIAVNQRIIPPTVNCQEPNPVFNETAQCLYPVQLGEIYPHTEILRAGVSAMGFGGINSHVTLSSADPPAAGLKPSLPERAILVSHQDTELFVLTGEASTELLRSVETLQQKAKGMSWAEMADLAAGAARGVKPGSPWRAALIAANPKELETRLEQLALILREVPLAQGEVRISPQRDLWLSHGAKGARIGFLFPGQGSQRLNMARTLIERHPWARDFLARADAWLEAEGFAPISRIIYRPLDRAKDGEQIEQWFQQLTQVAPQAIAFVSLLWQKYLHRLGIQPVAVGGHSLGELTAFQAAGIYDEKTLLCFAALRGEVIAKTSGGGGTMASLACSRQQAEQLLLGVKGYVAIANLNSPQQTVIAGEIASVQAVMDKAAGQNIQVRQLPVANAFHSQIVAPAAAALRRCAPLAAFAPAPQLQLFSSKTGGQIQEGIALADHFAEQMTAGVDFITLVKQLAQECDLLIEVGPGKVLSGLTAEITPAPLCLPLESKVGTARDWNTAIAAVFVQGGGIDWEFFYENRLIREFVPAAERLFLDNPCERPFAVAPAEIEQMSYFTPEKAESTPIAEQEFGEILSQYFSERGSFLAELIRADIENLV